MQPFEEHEVLLEGVHFDPKGGGPLHGACLWPKMTAEILSDRCNFENLILECGRPPLAKSSFHISLAKWLQHQAFEIISETDHSDR